MRPFFAFKVIDETNLHNIENIVVKGFSPIAIVSVFDKLTDEDNAKFIHSVL